MTGLLPVLCGLLIAGAILAFAARVSRRSHAGREPRGAGTAAVCPVRIPAAGRVAVPAATAQPRGEATRPFAYDNGLVAGERES